VEGETRSQRFEIAWGGLAYVAKNVAKNASVLAQPEAPLGSLLWNSVDGPGALLES
jgi:hypothetical protein